MKKHTDLKRLDSMSDRRRKQQASGRSVAFADNATTASGAGEEDELDGRSRETKQLVGNDFDLYILLKEMLTSNLAKENLDEEWRQGKSRRQKNAFKDYSKLLTATLLPTHYVPAGGGWALADNGFDLYRAKVKCIGTNLADCDFGEPVFLDFQPLSTRVNLMCKLMIIIQGACLERAGPPKLVQDRCIQFDGDQEKEAARQEARFRNNRIKSISCETLLSDTGFNDIKFVDSDTEIQISINNKGCGKSKKGQRPRLRRHYFAFSDDEGLKDGEDEEDEDGDLTYNVLNKYSFAGTDKESNEDDSCLFDMEHYFKYRLGRAGSHSKDYASAVYQQYSGSGRADASGVDAAVNTDESHVRNTRAEEEAKALVKSFVTTSTSTDAVNFIIEAFSKHQVLSPNTLTKEKSKLVDASTSTEDKVIDYILKPAEIIPLSKTRAIGTATVGAGTNSRLRTFLHRQPSVGMELPASSSSSNTGRFVSRYEIPISGCDEDDYHLFSDKEMYTYTHRQEYKVKANSQKDEDKEPAPAETQTQTQTEGEGEVEVEVEEPSVPKYCLAKSSSGSGSGSGSGSEATKVGEAVEAGTEPMADNKKDTLKSQKSGSALKIVSTRSKFTATSKAGRPRSWVFKFTNCFDSEEDARRIEQIKAGPKKSHEWSIFKSSGKAKQLNDNDDPDSDSDSGGFTVRQS